MYFAPKKSRPGVSQNGRKSGANCCTIERNLNPDGLLDALAGKREWMFGGHANVQFGNEKTLVFVKDNSPAVVMADTIVEHVLATRTLRFIFLNGCQSHELAQKVSLQ